MAVPGQFLVEPAPLPVVAQVAEGRGGAVDVRGWPEDGARPARQAQWRAALALRDCVFPVTDDTKSAL